MARRIRAAVVLASLLLVGPAQAGHYDFSVRSVRLQPDRSRSVRLQADQTQNPTFRADVAGVSLDVAVTRDGRPVRGLSAADFVLTDSSVTQRIDTAALETLPLSIFLVLDSSGSVSGPKMRYLLDASHALVTSLRGGDRISLVTFADRVATRVPLTADAAAVDTALRAVTAGGQTSLRDAIFTALQLIPRDRTRPIILVFSDGRDTASWLTSADVLAAVRRSGVVIHAVELVEEEDTRRDNNTLSAFRRQPSSPFLGELVAAAGGRRWAATDPVRLSGLFTGALNEMRSRYLLTYYPAGVDRAGWHPVAVRLARGRADVTHRPGYQVVAR